MLDFTGQVALITGGSRGIGAETAKLFAELGADVAISYYMDDAAADDVRTAVEAKGRRCLVIRADVSSERDCVQMVDLTAADLGRLDILVNNAGIWTEAAIERMTSDVLDRTIDVNIKGCFYTASAAVPHMKKQKTGNIIFVSSTAGQRGEAFHSHYAASKGALISLTKSLATELAPHNIRVNCIAPGWVDTDMSHENPRKQRRPQVSVAYTPGTGGQSRRACRPDRLHGLGLGQLHHRRNIKCQRRRGVGGIEVLCQGVLDACLWLTFPRFAGILRFVPNVCGA